MGSIAYINLGPPWFHSDVAFLHGQINALSFPCKYGTQTRKGIIKDRGQKIVASCIL